LDLHKKCIVKYALVGAGDAGLKKKIILKFLIGLSRYFKSLEYTPT
jgi:hypothetical protein